MIPRNLILLAALFALVAGFPAACHAQAQQLWVQRYNDKHDFDDYANSLALDAEGNVFIAGLSGVSADQYDCLTVKYDPDGNELWARTYRGPGRRHNAAYAVAVDSAGDAYVAGFADGAPHRSECLLIKYDPDGGEMWVRRHGGHMDQAMADAMTLDAEGNVYLCGWSLNAAGNADYVTLKYSKDGDELWQREYDGPGHSDDFAFAVAVDGAGNVAVTGASQGAATGLDYATIKYDANGNHLWTRRYDGPGHGDDWATRVAVDAAGNTYVTGYAFTGRGGLNDNDYITIKYDPNGVRLWLARYDGPGHDDDEPYALAVDANGNVYVSGFSARSSTASDYATIKYDTNGHRLWVARYLSPGDGAGGADAITLDAQGNVYVAGQSTGTNGVYDYATVKYSPDGAQIWARRYDGPGHGVDEANGVAVDSHGYTYVTGWSLGAGTGIDCATIKYGR